MPLSVTIFPGKFHNGAHYYFLNQLWKQNQHRNPLITMEFAELSSWSTRTTVHHTFRVSDPRIWKPDDCPVSATTLSRRSCVALPAMCEVNTGEGPLDRPREHRSS